MDDELIEICHEIFNTIISQITIHLRFMDVALDNYIYVPSISGIDIECDGTYLYYNPFYIIQTYRQDPKIMTRGYLHIVLHSIFRHQVLTFDGNKKLWNLACDIAVENMIDELDLDCTRVVNEDQEREMLKLKRNIDLLTAQKIYHYLHDELNSDQIKLLEQAFYFDDHSRWYSIRDVVGSNQNLYGEESKDDPTKSGNNNYENASHDTGERKELDPSSIDDKLTEQEIMKIKHSLDQWKDISERIQTDLETYSNEYSDETNTMVQSLERLNREKYNYSTFLRKFMTNGEKQMINMDEFDYVFYTYGLRLYHNMPLIESLEYKETNAIKNFVIVIDTSGSVSGPIVQSFLQKTYNIFQQKENFFNRFNIHIIQCDTKIQEDQKITSMEQFNTYIENMEIKGLGGTDFRAAFKYVDELIEQGEFDDLQGLIYFTDGDGIYPVKMPKYKSAFVFLDNAAAMQANVPVWAIKYIIDDSELMED